MTQASIWRERTIELAQWRVEYWNMMGRDTRHMYVIRDGWA